MTALGINMSTRDPDLFCWPAHSFHGKPLDLLEVEDKIDELEARFIRRSDEWPLPYVELEEIEDEIEQLEKVRARIWNAWQQSISELRKQTITE